MELIKKHKIILTLFVLAIILIFTFNFLRSYFSPIIYVVGGRIAVPQLPYKVSCDYDGKFNPPQCHSDKYTCQYSECTLKDNFTPDEISCGGNIGHSPKETKLCNSGRYVCNSPYNPDDAVECILN